MGVSKLLRGPSQPDENSWGRGEGGTIGNSGWWGRGGGVPPGSPNPDTIFQTKKLYFSHPFSEQVSKKLCHKREETSRLRQT